MFLWAGNLRTTQLYCDSLGNISRPTPLPWRQWYWTSKLSYRMPWEQCSRMLNNKNVPSTGPRPCGSIFKNSVLPPAIWSKPTTINSWASTPCHFSQPEPSHQPLNPSPPWLTSLNLSASSSTMSGIHNSLQTSGPPLPGPSTTTSCTAIMTLNAGIVA